MTFGEHIHPGEADFFSFVSEVTGLRLVFEDYGDCGYLYALNTRNEIEDAVFVYRVESETHQSALVLEVTWSEDGWKACAQLDAKPVAIFNYELRQSFSATGSPPSPGWERVSQEEAEACFATRQ